MTINQRQPSLLDVVPIDMVLISPSVVLSRKVVGGVQHANLNS